VQGLPLTTTTWTQTSREHANKKGSMSEQFIEHETSAHQLAITTETICIANENSGREMCVATEAIEDAWRAMLIRRRRR
jgi:hypothetical protein